MSYKIQSSCMIPFSDAGITRPTTRNILHEYGLNTRRSFRVASMKRDNHTAKFAWVQQQEWSFVLFRFLFSSQRTLDYLETACNYKGGTMIWGGRRTDQNTDLIFLYILKFASYRNNMLFPVVLPFAVRVSANFSVIFNNFPYMAIKLHDFLQNSNITGMAVSRSQSYLTSMNSMERKLLNQ